MLIEAIASGDAQQLLADLVALGLTDGVVYGRVVNGWLPVEPFDDAQRLASRQIPPTHRSRYRRRRLTRRERRQPMTSKRWQSFTPSARSSPW